MLKLVRSLSSSSLRIFLSNGYSLELLFILFYNQTNKNHMGMDDIYSSLVSIKPKRSTFDKFIKRLIENNIVQKTNLLDKRKVGLILSIKNYEEFGSLLHKLNVK